MSHSSKNVIAEEFEMRYLGKSGEVRYSGFFFLPYLFLVNPLVITAPNRNNKLFSSGDGTQGLVHAEQALQLYASHILSPASSLYK